MLLLQCLSSPRAHSTAGVPVNYQLIKGNLIECSDMQLVLTGTFRLNKEYEIVEYKYDFKTSNCVSRAACSSFMLIIF